MWKIEKGLEKSTEKLKLEKRKIFKKNEKTFSVKWEHPRRESNPGL